MKASISLLLLFVLMAGRTASAAPKIILKLDDLYASKGVCPCAKTFDLLIQKQVKAGFGIIAGRLDETAAETLKPYMEAVNAKGEKLFEIWHHGLDHVNPEFKGTPYEYQKAHFEDADRLVKNLLGLQMRTFGTPFNGSDENTNRVVAENPHYKVFMFSNIVPSDPAGILYLNNRVNVENGVGNPDFEYLRDNYLKAKDRYSDFMILQAHPNNWPPEKLEQFSQVLDFLLAEGCEFILPYEYYESQVKK